MGGGGAHPADNNGSKSTQQTPTGSLGPGSETGRVSCGLKRPHSGWVGVAEEAIHLGGGGDNWWFQEGAEL